MRNQYPGVCYQCGEPVAAREGHFQKSKGSRRWLLHHAGCAVYFRNKPEQHVSELTEAQRVVWRKARKEHDRKGLPTDADKDSSVS